MKRLPSPALVIALIALVAASGGTAVGLSGSEAPSASVAKKKAVAKRGPRGKTGPRGAKGDKGDVGVQGASGPNLVASLNPTAGPFVTLAPGETGHSSVQCPYNNGSISGGVEVFEENSLTPAYGVASQDDRGNAYNWEAFGVNNGTATVRMRVIAYCVPLNHAARP